MNDKADYWQQQHRKINQQKRKYYFQSTINKMENMLKGADKLL